MSNSRDGRLAEFLYDKLEQYMADGDNIPSDYVFEGWIGEFWEKEATL